MQLPSLLAALAALSLIVTASPAPHRMNGRMALNKAPPTPVEARAALYTVGSASARVSDEDEDATPIEARAALYTAASASARVSDEDDNEDPTPVEARAALYTAVSASARVPDENAAENA